MRIVSITRRVIAVCVIWGAGFATANETIDATDASICAPDAVALGGFDAISYHHQGGPVLGSSEFEFTHQALTYRFNTEANRSLFAGDPAKYLPTYRGWCSTNLAMGRLACPDYSNYKIEDGRVLLFEHTGFTNGRDIWNTNPILHKKQADENFLRFLNP